MYSIELTLIRIERLSRTLELEGGRGPGRRLLAVPHSFRVGHRSPVQPLSRCEPTQNTIANRSKCNKLLQSVIDPLAYTSIGPKGLVMRTDVERTRKQCQSRGGLQPTKCSLSRGRVAIPSHLPAFRGEQMCSPFVVPLKYVRFLCCSDNSHWVKTQPQADGIEPR